MVVVSAAVTAASRLPGSSLASSALASSTLARVGHFAPKVASPEKDFFGPASFAFAAESLSIPL